MATTLQFRRGTAAEAAALTGQEAELFYDYENKILYVHDGVNAGGKGIGLDDTTNTVVSGVLSGNTITFTREDATTFDLDVTGLYDNVNTFVASGAVTGSTLTLTMNDASTVDVDVSSLLDDTNTVTSVAGKTGDVTLVKVDVGLGNADNTSDLDKPVSTATQTALNGKQDADANIVSDGAYVHTDNNYTSAEKTKLGGIEDGATADQTGAEIKTAYEGNLNTNAYTDAEKSKLAGVEASANNYSHPASHSPSIITQDADNRFVTDAEKATWNGKIDAETLTSLTLVGNTLTYTDENGDPVAYDLSTYLDDTNLSYIVSGTYVVDEPLAGDKNLKFTRSDASTFYVDASMFLDDTNLVTSVAGKTGVVTLAKADVGLGNVDNTSDADKPVSTATQTALDGKVDDSQVLTDVPAGAVFTDTDTTYSPADPGTDGTDGTDGLLTDADKFKLDGVEAGANNYSHPANHAISDVTGLQTALDGKEPADGTILKAPAGSSKGDILYHDGSNWTRLPAGTVGQVLTVQADGTLAWA